MADLQKARDIGQGDLLEILYGIQSKPENIDPHEMAFVDEEDDPVCTKEFVLHSRGLDQKVRGDRHKPPF